MRAALLTTAEIARTLGVSRRWVYLQVEQHDLPAYKLGDRALRFDSDAVKRWLDARKVGDWNAAESCVTPISRVPL